MTHHEGPEERSRARRDLLAAGLRRLEEAGVEDARRNAEWLLEEVLGVGRAGLYASPEAPVAPADARRFEALLARRAAREPLQYVLGHADFYGFRLVVTPDVLIPRPETEQVVEAALALVAPVPAPRVLDVGTGSGCIPLAVARERPDAVVVACDVSEAALAVARANAAALDIQVDWRRADVLSGDFPACVPSGLDLLISNPPYVPPSEAGEMAPEVRDHEPALALFTGGDPLQFYRALVRHASVLLRPGGHAVFETHAEHGEKVCRLLEEEKFHGVRLEHDLAGRPRIAVGRRP